MGLQRNRDKEKKKDGMKQETTYKIRQKIGFYQRI
jgi:hypothetical protein